MLTFIGFDPVVLRDNVITLLVAGHKTTTILTSWCLYLLTQHPEVEKKLVEEIFTITKGDADRPLTDQDLKQAVYLDMVLKETLRFVSFHLLLFPLHLLVSPPIASILRPSLPFATPRSPSSSVVSACPRAPGSWSTSSTFIAIPSTGACSFSSFPPRHSSPSYPCPCSCPPFPSPTSPHLLLLRPNPDAFDPLRFTKDNVSKMHPYQWIPFGGGARSCLGLLFGLTEVKVTLMTLLRSDSSFSPSSLPTPLFPL